MFVARLQLFVLLLCDVQPNAQGCFFWQRFNEVQICLFANHTEGELRRAPEHFRVFKRNKAKQTASDEPPSPVCGHLSSSGSENQ